MVHVVWICFAQHGGLSSAGGDWHSLGELSSCSGVKSAGRRMPLTNVNPGLINHSLIVVNSA